MRGRPPEPVPEEFAASYCNWIASGKPAAQWHRLEGNPAQQTVSDWTQKDSSFAGRVACAREIGQDVIADDCLEIADDATNDWMERVGKDGASDGWELNGEHVQRSKLRIETRLKLLACWNPKKYGAKASLEHSGKLSLDALIGQTLGEAKPEGTE